MTLIPAAATGGISAIAVNPANPDSLVAAAGSILYRSTDGGASWASIPFCTVQDLVATDSEPLGAVFWASCAVDLDSFAFPSTDGRLYYSADAGATWSLVRETAFLGITKLEVNSSSLAMIDQEVIPYRPSPFFSASLATSGNPPIEWQEAPIGDVRVTGLKETPGDSPVAVVSFFYYPSTDFPAMPPPAGGVLRSTDRGHTWQSGSGLPNDDTGPLALDPFDPAHFLVASNDRLFESRDGAADWSQANSAFPSTVTAILFDPEEEGRIFLGTLNSGVYRSDDAGTTWIAWNSGLSDLGLQSLAASPGRVYAGTRSGRLFRLDTVNISPGPSRPAMIIAPRP